ncbi:hypothetical protein Mic7113_3452 [Allocoleopsis franciscana PCC 7113]|uniref:Uncharacterized protein n=1 Tax=Allocoleopsis franciscana PCC 7113 TaxID=1173027 RepID=K9WHA1_9CYAN|nr:hypothetical protein Mic7113_3452 [Allocoleopsis franciscana PCC 7113]
MSSRGCSSSAALGGAKNAKCGLGKGDHKKIQIG